MAAVWPRRGLLQYYDSLGGSGSSILAHLARWLTDDVADKGLGQLLPAVKDGQIRQEAERSGMPRQVSRAVNILAFCVVNCFAYIEGHIWSVETLVAGGKVLLVPVAAVSLHTMPGG